VKSLFATLVLFLALTQSATAVSEADLLPVDQAYPITIQANSANEIQINWKIAKGYYLYRHRFAVSAVDGSVIVGNMALPAGKKYRDEFFGDVETYRQQVSAIVQIQNPKQLPVIALRIKFQGCADIGVCYPPTTKLLSVTMPASTASMATAASTSSASSNGGAELLGLGKIRNDLLGADKALPEEQAFVVEAIIKDANSILVRLTPAPGYYLYQNKMQFMLSSKDAPVILGNPALPTAEQYPDPEFGTVPVYFKQVEIPLALMRTSTDAATLNLTIDYQGCKIDGICYPPMTKNFQLQLPAGGIIAVGATAPDIAPVSNSRMADQGAPTAGWLPAILLALLGGLILNLMPCVLPVLSFKAMALAQAGSAGHARQHALWYTAGVMSSFAALGIGVLALRSAGQALGWGFQLQQPIVVGALALLMFAIGLMMSGLFNWGSGFAGMGQSLTEKSGPAGDFFTGVLAVVVASPCTAPFMGSALAYAFSAHWLLALAVFLALGFGLAAPFLLIGFMPTLATKLPKPGAWMDTLKHWLAYPMYFTAAWLAWVFGNQKGVNGLGLLLISAITLSLALWWYERQKMQPSLSNKIVVLTIAILAALSFSFALQQTLSTKATGIVGKNYEAFSTARLNELRAQGKPVFVDMTADWCITCKVNEKAVLHTDAFTKLLKDTGTVYMVGDWTNQDTEITAYLDQYKTPGVPLYVVYPNGPGAGKKLPQLLTLDMMRETLQTGP
jgi:thiol:disulfide interchange protein